MTMFAHESTHVSITLEFCPPDTNCKMASLHARTLNWYMLWSGENVNQTFPVVLSATLLTRNVSSVENMKTHIQSIVKLKWHIIFTDSLLFARIMTLVSVLLQWVGTYANLEANDRAAFTQNLRCHLLEELCWCQDTLLSQGICACPIDVI